MTDVINRCNTITPCTKSRRVVHGTFVGNKPHHAIPDVAMTLSRLFVSYCPYNLAFKRICPLSHKAIKCLNFHLKHTTAFFDWYNCTAYFTVYSLLNWVSSLNTRMIGQFLRKHQPNLCNFVNVSSTYQV